MNRKIILNKKEKEKGQFKKMINSVSIGSCCHETSTSGIGTEARSEAGSFTSSERMKKKSKKKSSAKKGPVNDWERSVNGSSPSSTVDQFSSTGSLLSHLVKTSHILNGYRSPRHPSKESDVVCGSEEMSDPTETDQPVSESDSSVKVIPISSSDQNENKENIKESISVPSVTLTRIDSSASPSCSKSSHCDTTADEPLPSCSRLQETSSKVENSNSNFADMSSTEIASTGCAQQHQMLQHHQQHQQQTDYMGLALKQWSMYLGNVLLNFIHKECKNNNDQCAASTSVEQVQQQQLSNLAVAVGSRATNSFLQAAVAAAASSNSGASCSQTSSASGSKSSRNKRSSSSSFHSAVPDPGQVVNSVDGAANLIGDATTVISQGYCPCCHYHSHLQQQQQFQQQQQQQQSTTATMNQQQQQVMLAAAAAAAQQQQQAQQSCANNFQQVGYYNYAANFSPFFASQRHYVSHVAKLFQKSKLGSRVFICI